MHSPEVGSFTEWGFWPTWHTLKCDGLIGLAMCWCQALTSPTVPGYVPGRSKAEDSAEDRCAAKKINGGPSCTALRCLRGCENLE
jgi:hypothetical protein